MLTAAVGAVGAAGSVRPAGGVRTVGPQGGPCWQTGSSKRTKAVKRGRGSSQRKAGISKNLERGQKALIEMVKIGQ